jgi:hypothetical protein
VSSIFAPIEACFRRKLKICVTFYVSAFLTGKTGTRFLLCLGWRETGGVRYNIYLNDKDLDSDPGNSQTIKTEISWKFSSHILGL